MAIDPIMLALCKGENTAGGSSLPYIQLTTPIVYGQTVRLTKEESLALSNAYNSLRPAVILFHTELLGVFISVAHLNIDNVNGTSRAYLTAILSGETCISFYFRLGNEHIENTGIDNAYYWEVEMFLASMTPMEIE